ncbi:LANO_0E05490g1_1 [Lachancea nothofagi CBS 11611]|uniref:LANO_0E05490g1_1 n=1 Tax=Lachancea nothofagi CBS 11611 TaxID=1266666 RepID=A0A1G4JTD5_9SACH|nr:LANO_0E05490g1_1 [Lachancea nothofagi CBS 11611]
MLDLTLDSASSVWLILEVVVAWIAFQWVIFKLLGVSVGIIDPLRFRIRSIRVRNLLSIQFVYYSFWNHGVVLHGLKLELPRGREIKKNANSTQESPENYFTVPRWCQWLIIRLLNLFRQYNIVLEKTELNGVKVDNMVVKLVGHGSRLDVSILIKDAALADIAACSGSVIEFSGEINFQRPVMPLQDLVVDLKFRGVSASYERLVTYIESGQEGEPGQSEPSSNGNESTGEPAIPAGLGGTSDSEASACIHYIKSQLLQAGDFVAMLNKVNIALDGVAVSDIPLSRNPELTDTASLLEFEVSLSNLTFAITRLDCHSPGFKLTFSPNEFPLNLQCTMSSIAFKVHQNLKNETAGRETYQFCEIPSVALYGDTNLLSLRSMEENFDEPIETVVRLVGHISSPVLDFEIAQYSLLKSFKDNLKVFQCLLKDDDDVTPPTCAKTLEKKQAILTYFQHILPHVESKITIEDPMTLISDGCELLVQKCSILSIQTKSDKYRLSGEADEKELYYKWKNTIELMDYSFTYHNKFKKYEHRILTVTNVSIMTLAQLVPNIRTNINAGVDVCELDLSELSTLMALNKIFRKANSKMLLVEEEHFDKLYEKFASFLESTKQENLKDKRLLKETEVCPKAQLFEQLPSFFDGMRTSVRGLKITVGARSVFMSNDIFTDLTPQSPEDLVDGELRKMSHSFERIQLSLSGPGEQSRVSDEQSNSDGSTLINSMKTFSYDELGLDDSSSNFSAGREFIWLFRCSIHNMVTTLYSEKRTKRQTLSAKTVFKLPEFELAIYPDTPLLDKAEAAGSKVVVSINTGDCETMLSLMTVFLVFSAAHTFKQTFTRDVNQHARESKAKRHLSTQYAKKGKRSFLARLMKKELLDLISFEFNARSLSMVIILPNGVKTRVEAFRSSITCTDISNLTIQGHFFRFCVESPRVTNFWVRMMTIVNFKAQGNIKDVINQSKDTFGKGTEPTVMLSNDMWNFNIPHAFEMYQIFDNISTTVKSIKQMIYSLKTSSNKNVIKPHVSKPLRLPSINLRSKRWVLSVEDDAFESQLSMIFQVGLKEQRSRLEKYEIFEKTVAKELTTKHKGMRRSETANMDIIRKHKHTDSLDSIRAARRGSVPTLNQPDVTEKPDHIPQQDHFRYVEDAELRAREFHKLQEQISTSWIRRIQAFKIKEQIEFLKNFEYLWGKVDPECFPPSANKRIMAFVSSPPLMNIILEDIDVTISQPSFGVDNSPNFIYDVGKGVPKDTKYSIMVPMHLNAEFREIRCHLRDYPLPFVHLPDLTAKQREASGGASIRLHGDVIISEDIIRSDAELRTLFVPLVPSATLENDDKFYSLLVPRTLTAIKTYAKIDLELNSEETTLVAWNGSYSPAIQQAMQCFDNFSKPPIDPSPKLGFWDKIRETFHARTSVRWKNGGQLNVALKGGKSPYTMGGEAAGFVVGLKGDVEVGCNIADDPRKFVSLTSQEVFFSIPNFFAKPLLSWSRSSKDSLFFPSYENTNLQQYAFYYDMIELPDIKQLSDDIHVMGRAYLEKTAIRLTGGITLNVGFVFERLESDLKKRTFESKSHWDTRLCNPVLVEDLGDHDSYKGFRSDFIHLSFTLLSSNPKAYNVLQLTPGAFRTFFGWWHSFSGNSPIRRGPLFGMNSMSPKFGVHLYTISYHADVAPLFISHMHELFDPDNKMKGVADRVTSFVGLKAKSEHFVMDLHQRKEVLHEYKHELNTTKRISRLMLHEGYVSNFGIDVRTVQAQFKEATYADDQSSHFDIFDDDMTWFDPSDYTEVFLDRMGDRIPSVSINSLVYSPKFVYRKHASYGDKYQVNFETCEKIEPFKNSDYHDCSLQSTVRSPLYLIERRLNALEEKKLKVAEELKQQPQQGLQEKKKLLENKLEMIQAAILQVKKLLQDFSEYENYDASEDEDSKADLKTEKIPDSAQSIKKHDCAEFEWLTKKSFSKTFEHRFFIFSMYLKWNDTVRGAVYSYIHLLDFNRELAYITNHKAVQRVNDVIRNAEGTQVEKLESIVESTNSDSVHNLQSEEIESLDAGEDILSVFEEGLRSLQTDFDFVTHDNHVVQFVAPQIQFTTTKKPDVCTMITAPSIKLKTISFDTNVTQNQYNSDVFMNRYSVALLKANVFVFHKDSMDESYDVFFNEEGYDQNKEQNWQPWLGVELCFDSASLGKEALIQNLSAIFRFDRVFSFANFSGINEQNLNNKMICQLPRTIISSNSRQYLALYDVIAHLLVYAEPKSAHLRKEVEKLMLSYDSANLLHLKRVVTDLQQKIVALKLLEKELAFRRHILDADGIDDLETIRKNKYESLISLYILMKVLNMGSQEHAAEDQKMLWDLEAKEIILHMLHDDGTPFLDVALAKSYFQRVQSSYGYNSNKVVIGVAQIFNLDQGVIFNNLLGPSDARKGIEHNGESKPLIVLEWEIEKPVGGMKVINNATTIFRGLDINVEQETLTKIMRWAFPAEIEEYIQEHNRSSMQYEDTGDDYASTMSDQHSFTIGKIGKEGKPVESPDDVDEMFKRSSDYMVINNMVINSFKLTISYRGNGATRLINVTNFGFLFPRLTFHNQTITMVDLTMMVKQVLLKSLFKHAGKFLGNKLKKHSLNIDTSNPPLRQLSSYRSYTKVEDLQEDRIPEQEKEQDTHISS